jgi:hypothetical protein
MITHLFSADKKLFCHSEEICHLAFLRSQRSPGGEIGRRTGLKILGLVTTVRVQVPPWAQKHDFE